MCHALTKESETCKKCRSQYGLPKHVWVHAQYDSETKRLIYALKYGRVRGAASVIASLLDDTLPYFEPSSTVFVPIPTSPARVRARGLDHTLLIAKELSAIRDIPVATPLFRSTNTQQVGASRKLRLSQLDGAMQYKNNNIDVRSRIILIDDLMTTGGSLIAATRTLKQAGHTHVYAAAFAQK